MDRVLIAREVAGLLVGIGIRAERLRPDVRLLQDLRIDGDDAVGFFDAVSARFGTDLSALRAKWGSYFGPEGLSVMAAIPVALGSAVAGAAAALAGLPDLLCAMSAAMGAVAVWLVSQSIGAGRPVRSVSAKWWTPSSVVPGMPWRGPATGGGRDHERRAWVRHLRRPGPSAKSRMVPRLLVTLWLTALV